MPERLVRVMVVFSTASPTFCVFELDQSYLSTAPDLVARFPKKGMPAINLIFSKGWAKCKL
jgi:hypothetical protein